VVNEVFKTKNEIGQPLLARDGLGLGDRVFIDDYFSSIYSAPNWDLRIAFFRARLNFRIYEGNFCSRGQAFDDNTAFAEGENFYVLRFEGTPVFAVDDFLAVAIKDGARGNRNGVR